MVCGVFMFASSSAFSCPLSWSVYKQRVKEGTGTYNTASSNHKVDVTVFRRTMYKCSNENVFELQTTWSTDLRGTEAVKSFQQFRSNVSVSYAEEKRDDGELIVTVEDRIRRRVEISVYSASRYGWSNWFKLENNCQI